MPARCYGATPVTYFDWHEQPAYWADVTRHFPVAANRLAVGCGTASVSSPQRVGARPPRVIVTVSRPAAREDPSSASQRGEYGARGFLPVEAPRALRAPPGEIEAQRRVFDQCAEVARDIVDV